MGSLVETVLMTGDCELTENSGFQFVDLQFFDPPDQAWAQPFSNLQPFMACKTLYYEAAAVFFREKTFILGSKLPRNALFHIIFAFGEMPDAIPY
jgi:hypothetical protein